jgi:hypothetical protein
MNVVVIGDSHLFFSFFETRRGRIAPAELRCKSRSTQRDRPRLSGGPFRNTIAEFLRLSRPAPHALSDRGDARAKNCSTRRLRLSAEVFLIIVVQLAAQMQPHLVQQHGPLELCRFCF